MLKYLSVRCCSSVALVFRKPQRPPDLKVLPGDITLTGPHASQRLLVAVEEGGDMVGDRTAQATFTSANPAVAVVDGGVVRPVGDGETTITANRGWQTSDGESEGRPVPRRRSTGASATTSFRC